MRDGQSCIVIIPIANGPADVFLDKFLLFQQIASQKVPNSTSLASALSQVCSGIRKTISRVTCSQNLNSPTYISHPVTRSQQSNSIHVEGVLDQELDKKLTAFRRIFPYLLKAVRKPSQAAKSESFQAHLTYSFIELFRDILEHICVLSAADSVSSRTPHQLQKSRRSTRAKPQVATSQRANLSREKPTTKLCQLFISLMTALETSDTIDRDVLEGLIYFLIHRVGDTLKIFVFGDDKNEVLAPKGSNRTSDSQALTYDEERKNAEARAPYLIYILSHVIPFATGQSHASLTSKAPLVAISNFPSHKKSLSSQSTESLQSTLVTALFGSAYAAEFIESISQPICPENQAEEGRFGPKIIDQDVEKWFKEEVWRILGWEILAGSIAW